MDNVTSNVTRIVEYKFVDYAHTEIIRGKACCAIAAASYIIDSYIWLKFRKRDCLLLCANLHIDSK